MSEPRLVEPFIARYRRLSLLGRGGSGVVHAAWDDFVDRPVAVKTVPCSARGDAHREARLTARLRHPAFVAVHDVWSDAQGTHIAMERVPGLTLKRCLLDGAVSPPVACGWMAQLAQALAAAHAAGLVHGDIKPSNLMLEPPPQDGCAGGEDDLAARLRAATPAQQARWRLRVLDMGIARPVDPLATATGTVPPAGAGTLAYMAPEQLQGQAASPASDAYALGLVLLQCLLGLPADAAHGGGAAAWRRLQGGWRDWALDGLGTTTHQALLRWPALLHPLLGRLLQADPALRPHDMAALEQALLHDGAAEAGAAAPAPTPARPPAQPPRTDARPAASVWSWGVGTATLASVVAGVTTVALQLALQPAALKVIAVPGLPALGWQVPQPACMPALRRPVAAVHRLKPSWSRHGCASLWAVRGKAAADGLLQANLIR